MITVGMLIAELKQLDPGLVVVVDGKGNQEGGVVDATGVEVIERIKGWAGGQPSLEYMDPADLESPPPPYPLCHIR